MAQIQKSAGKNLIIADPIILFQEDFGDIEQLTDNDEHTVNISLCVDSLYNCYITYLEGYYGSNDYEVWYVTNS